MPGWTVGGFQGGEGSDSAAEWNVENVLDELDYPREWYLDTATNDLYYFHNGTAGTPPVSVNACTHHIHVIHHDESRYFDECAS